MIMGAMMSIFLFGSMNYNTVAAAETESACEVQAQSFASDDLIINADQYEVVKPNATDVYNKVFYKGETAIIYVNGDGDTDLDLYVYDENSNLVDSDTDETDTCICSFTPKWRGNFTIKVKNRGNISNRYHLRVVQW